MKRDYILVTPVKNEVKNIDRLVESVINQSIPPVLWVIVDDNSTDGSYEKLKRYSIKYDFMRVIKYPERKSYDVGIHYSEVCKFGFEFAVSYCEKENISYEYVGLLDADIYVEKDYFEKLIEFFEHNPMFGILSGEIYSWNGKDYIKESRRDDLPRGAARLWRKQCFFETEGFLITYSPDTVSNIKALMHGWKIEKIKNAKAYQSRLTSSAIGAYKGWKKNGEAAYYLHKSPIIVILKSLNLMIRGNLKAGLGYINGYFSSFVNKRKRIEDEEIIEYNKKYDIKTVINYWLRGSKNEKI